MPLNKNKILVAFSVTNCICYDQRVLKIADKVSSLHCTITIIGRTTGNCCNDDKVPFKTRRFRMLFRRGFLFYKFFNLRLFFYLFFNRFDLLVANDLDTLLPNFLVSKLKHIPIVYDSHEYFTGVPEIQQRPLVKWVWTTIEKMIFPHLKYIMTVSESIAGQYENEYGIRPITIRNCSGSTSHIIPLTREELGIRPDHLLLLLQGAGINIDRGGEELIEAVYLTENVSLLIIGSGDIIENLKTRVKELDLSDRVKFIQKVPWEELMRYTKGADAGLSLDKPTNMNYEFSLPNKLFDYISAGIPVIAGDLAEVRKVLKENSCGIIIDKVTPELISDAISALRDNPLKLAELKRNAIVASMKLNWEMEGKKVTGFYENVLNNEIDR